MEIRFHDMLANDIASSAAAGVRVSKNIVYALLGDICVAAVRSRKLRPIRPESDTVHQPKYAKNTIPVQPESLR